MKKGTYERVFSRVPITDFFVRAVMYWGKQEDVSKSTEQKVRRIARYVIDNNLEGDGNVEIYRLPICSERMLMKAIKNNFDNHLIIDEILHNPNLNEKHVTAILEVWKKDYRKYFLSDQMRWTRHMILTCPYMPEQEIRDFSNAKYSCIRADIAKNESCPMDILERLSRDAATSVRMGVARNPNTPENILLKLVDDNSMLVRKCVALRWDKTEAVIRKLAKYMSEFDVARSVVRALNCPADVLNKYASYSHKYDPDCTRIIRGTVAVHPNLSHEGWKILYNDPNSCWSNYALASKLCPVELVKTFDNKAKFASDAAYYITMRDDLTEDIINMFLGDTNARIREVAIRNCELPLETLFKYHNDKSKYVRIELMRKFQGKEELFDLIRSTKCDPARVFDYLGQAILTMGPGSAKKFIDFVDSYGIEKCKYYVGMYLSSSNCSEKELWMVYQKFLHEDGILFDNFGVEMLTLIIGRKQVSNKTVERCIEQATRYGEKEMKDFIRHLNGRTFFSSTMLSMCIEYIKQEKASKK